MTHSDFNEETLIAYLKGELDPAQTAAVEAWYDASEENRKMLGDIYYILYVNDRINDTADIDVEKALRRVKERMRERRNPMRRRIVRMAAAAAVLLLVGGAGLTTFSLAKRMAQPVTVFTELGERSQALLPDGTKVWLNSSSRIEYSSSLFSRKRRVKMDGEAYFEVEHDPHAPFIVSTNGLDIEVLGTRFNVRNDESEHRVTTVLLEGAVRASAEENGKNGEKSVRLHPDQQLVFDTRTHDMQLSECPAAENSIVWIDGRFHFEHQTFEEIVNELNRYYNVEIRFLDDSLREMRFSGDFSVQDGIYHIMSVLQLTYKFNYRIVGTDIEIFANTK